MAETIRKDEQASSRAWRRAGYAFAAALALSVLADLFVEHHPKFGVDGTVGFLAWYGLIAAAALILAAWVAGLVLRRPADYYDR